MQPVLLPYARPAHTLGCASVSPCCQTLPTLLREPAPAQQRDLPSLTHPQILGPGHWRGSSCGSWLQLAAPPQGYCAPAQRSARLCIASEMTPRCCSLPARGVQPCACAAIIQAIRRCQLGFVVVREQTRPRSSPRALGILLGQSSALPGSPAWAARCIPPGPRCWTCHVSCVSGLMWGPERLGVGLGQGGMC